MNDPSPTPAAPAVSAADAPSAAAVVPLLDIAGLKTYFFTSEGVSRAVDGVSFRIAPRRSLGLVGESGCGKSVTALSILRLIPDPPGRIVDGEIRFQGRALTRLSEAELREVRGNRISMIFQEPMTSLNPVFTVGDQVAEVFRVHRGMKKKAAWAEAGRMLDLVRIPAARERLGDYPHQMSGGMRQRVMIAMALACNPDLLIADEPTTALDVTVQAQILLLMEELKKTFHSSILMITHDLGVVAEMCDEVAVMYAGRIIEQSPVDILFRRPSHPYTQGLLAAIPRRDDLCGRGSIQPIPGNVPNPIRFPSGCRFHPRCAFADEECRVKEPIEEELEPGHRVACLHARAIQAGTRPRRALESQTIPG
jgi:oligopeptide/dipeptide ABC transporter ATP-binding protein